MAARMVNLIISIRWFSQVGNLKSPGSDQLPINALNRKLWSSSKSKQLGIKKRLEIKIIGHERQGVSPSQRSETVLEGDERVHSAIKLQFRFHRPSGLKSFHIERSFNLTNSGGSIWRHAHCSRAWDSYARAADCLISMTKSSPHDGQRTIQCMRQSKALLFNLSYFIIIIAGDLRMSSA